MKTALVIFSLFVFVNVACGIDRRLQTANIDFINVESNNRKVIPQAPPNQKKGVATLIPTTSKPAQQPVPELPKPQPPKPAVVAAPTTTVKPITTPASKVKQLAKNYDDRVSEIGKQVESEKGKFNLTGSDFPALPKTSGTAPQGAHGTRSWASVVASEKPKYAGIKV
ncbi:uncharacterized protein LOC143918470 [Arctopsyche grandis]|uniref:uncharacterized protein LOC143918470 n=1 Tax=Arctopsyche grandis TaxID=121162 RepID=UPI00406D68AE